MVVSSFNLDEPPIDGGLHTAQTALGIFVGTRPVQLATILVVHPELIPAEYEHRLASAGR